MAIKEGQWRGKGRVIDAAWEVKSDAYSLVLEFEVTRPGEDATTVYHWLHFTKQGQQLDAQTWEYRMTDLRNLGHKGDLNALAELVDKAPAGEAALARARKYFPAQVDLVLSERNGYVNVDSIFPGTGRGVPVKRENLASTESIRALFARGPFKAAGAPPAPELSQSPGSDDDSIPF